jgi:undecaprenyl-diphosphatase
MIGTPPSRVHTTIGRGDTAVLERPGVTKKSFQCHVAVTQRGQSAAMEVLSLLQKYDLDLFTRVFKQGERRMVIPMARAFSRSGDGYLHVLLPLLLFSIPSPGATSFAGLMVLSLLIERAVYWCLKNSLKRRRPHDAVPGLRSFVVASDQFSFPSGHSSGAFLLATCLTLVYGGPVTAVYLWAGGVAVSRVILGVHFPGDTFAGAAMGSGIAVLSASQLGLI